MRNAMTKGGGGLKTASGRLRCTPHLYIPNPGPTMTRNPGLSLDSDKKYPAKNLHENETWCYLCRIADQNMVFRKMAKKYMLLDATDALQEGDEWWAGPKGWLPCRVFMQLRYCLYRRPVDEVPAGRYRLLLPMDQAQPGDEIYRTRGNYWELSNHSVMSGWHFYRRFVKPVPGATDESRSGDKSFILKDELDICQKERDSHIRRFNSKCVDYNNLYAKYLDLEKELNTYKGMCRIWQDRHFNLVAALRSLGGCFDELSKILADEI